MGLFGKLKAAKNAITGGGASVTVQAGEAARGQEVPVTVHVVAKTGMAIDAVYLLVRGVERAELKDTDWEGGDRHKEIVRGRRTSYETRIDLAGPQELEEGQEYDWEGSFTVPYDAMPSVRGMMISHVWEIQAGLDKKGNDPDSGWQQIELR